MNRQERIAIVVSVSGVAWQVFAFFRYVLPCLLD